MENMISNGQGYWSSWSVLSVAHSMIGGSIEFLVRVQKTRSRSKRCLPCMTGIVHGVM
jgi:hypothetical protein